jgi:16S rRNA U516 pseudouridylate synthase RsuA-like enzyme
MGKPKRKLTPAEKAAKRRLKKETMIIFINGKEKRVKRPPAIQGLPVDEFIRRNADSIWLHEEEMWEYMSEPADDEES